jgi:hypothetical protein
LPRNRDEAPLWTTVRRGGIVEATMAAKRSRPREHLHDHADGTPWGKGHEGTIRFQPEKPLPSSLVRKLVKARVVENAAQRAK